MKSTVQVTGLQEITRRINGFRQQLFNEVGAIALEGADIVRDQAKANTAKFKEPTGALEAGIKSAVTWDHNTSKVFAGAGMDAAMNDVFVKYSKSGKRYYYPASVEYGHGDPKKGQRAFLRPALKAKRAAVRAHIAARVGALVAKAGT